LELAISITFFQVPKFSKFLLNNATSHERFVLSEE
jgi:hypothetical protein